MPASKLMTKGDVDVDEKHRLGRLATHVPGVLLLGHALLSAELRRKHPLILVAGSLYLALELAQHSGLFARVPRATPATWLFIVALALEAMKVANRTDLARPASAQAMGIMLVVLYVLLKLSLRTLLVEDPGGVHWGPPDHGHLALWALFALLVR